MTKTENLGGLDINVPERQSLEGYIPTFLSEHRTIVSIMSSPNSYNDRCSTVSNTVYFMVSLITDVDLRTELWLWFDGELKKQLESEKDATQDRKVQIQYNLSCVLQGKIMDFVGRHLTKPLEVGTE